MLKEVFNIEEIPKEYKFIFHCLSEDGKKSYDAYANPEELELKEFDTLIIEKKY